MTAMNIVHMRVKPGREKELLAIHAEEQQLDGMQHFWLVKTGERDFCFVGEWEDMESIVAARPAMIGQLDRMRSLLEDLGGGRGVTEPWSGTVAAESGNLASG